MLSAITWHCDGLYPYSVMNSLPVTSVTLAAFQTPPPPPRHPHPGTVSWGSVCIHASGFAASCSTQYRRCAFILTLVGQNGPWLWGTLRNFIYQEVKFEPDLIIHTTLSPILNHFFYFSLFKSLSKRKLFLGRKSIGVGGVHMPPLPPLQKLRVCSLPNTYSFTGVMIRWLVSCSVKMNLFGVSLLDSPSVSIVTWPSLHCWLVLALRAALCFFFYF